MKKEKTTVTLNTKTKEHLQQLRTIIPEITSMSSGIDYVVKDYYRMKKELEFIDNQTLNAAKKMTAMDVNISILTEMVTHLCYETATQIDEELDYFKREDLNLESYSVFDKHDPMYNLFRDRVINYRKKRKESLYM
ncbi:hypothetical protein F3280_13835 [Listeria monocytogenes]|nr:hypothetical protein [Listeria monocytogenes]